MKMIILLTSLLFTFKSCNKPDSRYPPEKYFDGQDLKIATAIYNNDKTALKNHIKAPGFNINKIGKQGITYLLYAVYAEQKKMVEFLLENGADPNLISPELDDKDPVWKNTITNKLPLSCVANSYFAYDMDYVKLLIKYGAKINDTRAEPPLIACMTSGVEKRTLKLVEYLLDKGADINIKTNGENPVFAAATISRWDTVNYLISRGADYTIVNHAGWSVAYLVQEEIAMNKGTEDRKEKVHALKRRLEKLGVEFPVKKGINIYEQKEEIDTTTSIH